MKNTNRFIVTLLIVSAYLLNACSGVAPSTSTVKNSQNGQSQEVVFSGEVEAINGSQWTINGHKISIDSSTQVDTNVQVGDIVRIEANVLPDGLVMASKIESSDVNDDNVNDNTSVLSDDNSNVNVNANFSDDNGNDNGNGTSGGPEQEILGNVETITSNSITIDGITYTIADFTEFNDLIAVGDLVRVHIIAIADGTFAIREIERILGTDVGNDNNNSGDDNSNFNTNDNLGNDNNLNDNTNIGDDNSNENIGDDNSNGNVSVGGDNSNDNTSIGDDNSNDNNDDYGSNDNHDDNNNDNSNSNSNDNHDD